MVETTYPRSTGANVASLAGADVVAASFRYASFGTGPVKFTVTTLNTISTVIPESVRVGANVTAIVATEKMYSPIYDYLVDLPVSYVAGDFTDGYPSMNRPSSYTGIGCTPNKDTGIYIANTQYKNGFGTQPKASSSNTMVWSVNGNYNQLRVAFGVQNDFCNICSNTDFAGRQVLFTVTADGNELYTKFVYSGDWSIGNSDEAVIVIPENTISLQITTRVAGSVDCVRPVLGSPRMRRRSTYANFLTSNIALYAPTSNFYCIANDVRSPAVFDGMFSFACNPTFSTKGKVEFKIEAVPKNTTFASKVTTDAFYYTIFDQEALRMSTTKGFVALPVNLTNYFSLLRQTFYQQTLSAEYNAYQLMDQDQCKDYRQHTKIYIINVLCQLVQVLLR
jgi:hypothetical protein